MAYMYPDSSGRFGADSPAMMQKSEFYKIIDSSSNVFLVNILDPRTINDNLKKSALLIKSVTLPNVGFSTYGTRRGGYETYHAGNIEISTVTLLSYNDINGSVHNYWYGWFNKIINGSLNDTYQSLNYRQFPDEYKVDIKIYKLSRATNEKSVEYTLKGCWPANVSGLELDWDNSDTPPIFNIELRVDKIEIETIPEKLDFVRDYKQIVSMLNIVNTNAKQILENETKNSKTSKSKIKNAFTKIDNTLKSKLKQAGKELIEVLQDRAESKIRSLLPKYLQTLDFFDFQVLIDQLYQRIKGWTIAKTSDYVRDFKWPPTNTIAAGKAYWYEELTDVSDFPDKNINDLVRWNPTDVSRFEQKKSKWYNNVADVSDFVGQDPAKVKRSEITKIPESYKGLTGNWYDNVTDLSDYSVSDVVDMILWKPTTVNTGVTR